MNDPTTIDEMKRAAAEAAVSEVSDGMVVGLGTGTTASLALEALAGRAKRGLKFTGVATSAATEAAARKLGLNLVELSGDLHVDVTLDGADEVEHGTLNLIKGLGGALLREKLIACASERLVIMVDDAKLVGRLGERAPVPVEVVRFGWESTVRRLADMGARPSLRKRSDGSPFVTDGGNVIVDCAFGALAEASSTAARLDRVVGVIEHGLFLGMTSRVYVGELGGVQTLP